MYKRLAHVHDACNVYCILYIATKGVAGNLNVKGIHRKIGILIEHRKIGILIELLAEVQVIWVSPAYSEIYEASIVYNRSNAF